LGDQYRLDPMAALHNRWGDPETPPPWLSLRQVDERARGTPDLLHAAIQCR